MDTPQNDRWSDSEVAKLLELFFFRESCVLRMLVHFNRSFEESRTRQIIVGAHQRDKHLIFSKLKLHETWWPEFFLELFRTQQACSHASMWLPMCCIFIWVTANELSKLVNCHDFLWFVLEVMGATVVIPFFPAHAHGVRPQNTMLARLWHSHGAHTVQSLNTSNTNQDITSHSPGKSSNRFFLSV